MVNPNKNDLGNKGLGLRQDLYYERNLLINPLTGRNKPSAERDKIRGANNHYGTTKAKWLFI